ncbi:hypothetical protein COCON_G00069840 [Conger conger]|uniref:Ig-like domain-containing protein n=1 Tax=Conger conger TaxID=82655 RepID=A0A9Q1I4F3_CONCO|nr:hypothetical protein COCON_G00069840 [Conger conger]
MCHGSSQHFWTPWCRCCGDRGKVTIADYPDSGVFTVTLRDLQRGDTAFYWCAVEGGSSASLYLSVTNGVPNLMVEDNMVVGAEGGSVSIRCFYSNLTRDGMRKWCRSGDWGSCLTLDSPLAERSPLITDNGEGAFGVRMRRLQRSDEGWYWCVAGDLQAPVHIAVLQDPNNTLIATTKNHTTEESSTVFYSSTATVHKTNRPGQGSQLCSGAQTCLRRTLWVLRHAGLVLVFLICTAVAFWKIWQNRRVLQSRENRRCGTKLRCQNNTDCL